MAYSEPPVGGYIHTICQVVWGGAHLYSQRVKGPDTRVGIGVNGLASV